MPCATEEWSGHAICRLQPVLHCFLLFWDYTLVISPLAQCNNFNGKMMRQWQKQRSSCSLAANLAFYCKVLVRTTTYQVTTRVKQSIWLHKQAVCSGKNFEKIIFVVEVKSTKTAKFIVLENFPLYGIYRSQTFVNQVMFLLKLFLCIHGKNTLQ